MTRSQRIFLAIALPLFAWLLHVSACDWHYRETIDYRAAPRSAIWVYVEPGSGLTTGITSQPFIGGFKAALGWGVFLPLALVGADIYWMLGWRRRGRRATGCCIACGYDLKGSPAANCPECGAARDKKG